MERHRVESIGLFLKTVLGEDHIIEQVLDEIPTIEKSLKESVKIIKKMNSKSNNINNKEIMKYFKWTMNEGKFNENLRIGFGSHD